MSQTMFLPRTCSLLVIIILASLPDQLIRTIAEAVRLAAVDNFTRFMQDALSQIAALRECSISLDRMASLDASLSEF